MRETLIGVQNQIYPVDRISFVIVAAQIVGAVSAQQGGSVRGRCDPPRVRGDCRLLVAEE